MFLFHSTIQQSRAVFDQLSNWARGSELEDGVEFVNVSSLEDRVLYSASPIPLDFDSAESIEGIENLAIDLPLDPAESSLDAISQVESYLEAIQELGGAGEALPDADYGQDEPSFEANFFPNVISPTIEIIFVDHGIENHESLIADIQNRSTSERQTEIVLVDGRSDGVLQITEALSGYSDVDAIHIISHGEAGQLNLGNAQLSESNVTGYTGRYSKLV